MPKVCADRVIMLCVIALVAWVIVGLPLLNSISWSQSQPSQEPPSEHPASEAKGEEPWLTKDAAGFFTFALFVVGGLQLGLFYWQLRYMRKGMDDAAVAANAASESARYLRNAERPFITPFEPTLRNYEKARLGSMDVVHVDFGLENIAKGVGFVLSYGIAHEICADGRQGTKELTVGDGIGRLPIGPGSRWKAEAGFDVFQISDDEITAILECKKTLYVYGYIRYLDLFGIVRRTGFSYEVVDSANSEDHEPERLAICVSNPSLWYNREEEDGQPS